MRGVRAAAWALGLPIRAVVVGAIRLYRLVLSPLTWGRCRFHPTCSAYAEEAVRVHGALKGGALATWRILRCSPLTGGGVDAVPARGRWRTGTYDGVTQEGT